MGIQVIILTLFVAILGVLSKDFSSTEAEVKIKKQDLSEDMVTPDRRNEVILEFNRKKKPGKKSSKKHSKKKGKKPGKKPDDPCVTTGGSHIDQPCIFPFTYHNNIYDGCTDIDDPDNFWCATKVGDTGEMVRGMWGYCRNSCHHHCVTEEGGPQSGLPCIFPFTYHDVTYDGCTAVDDVDGKSWCATKVGSTGIVMRSQWGYCPYKCKQDGGGTDKCNKDYYPCSLNTSCKKTATSCINDYCLSSNETCNIWAGSCCKKREKDCPKIGKGKCYQPCCKKKQEAKRKKCKNPACPSILEF